MANFQLDKIVAKKFWAIQLSDTENRSWIENDNYWKLSFNWSDIPVSYSETLTNINIVVAQTYPAYDKEKVKKIAKGIYDFNKIEEGDGILGINGERIVEKIGVVSSEFKHGFSKEIQININWVDNFKPDIAKNTIFDAHAEIQPVTAEILGYLSLPIEFGAISPIESYSVLDKISFKQTISEPSFKESPKNVTEKVQLFYGTNRNDTNSNEPNHLYGKDLAELKYGICSVSIPNNHIQGVIERPMSFFGISFPENSESHIIIDSIEQLNEDAFVDFIKSRISTLSTKSGLVFIHGFNVSFPEAARRTAQFVNDIPFGGAAGFFSWPSSGKPVPYFTDIEKADSSILAFEKFIDTIISNTQIEQLHIVAHSMGNRILTTTLKDISNKSEWVEKIKIINQIILGAPDIDQDVFNNSILPYFKRVGLRRTLYSSESDEALNISQALRGGRPKLGQGGQYVYVASGLDTVDATNIPRKGNNHSYIFEIDSLLNDLFYLLGQNIDPQNRRLKTATKNGLNYWLFPVRNL